MPHSAIRSTALIVASALLAGSVWASDPPAPQAAASSQPATTPVPVQAPAAAAAAQVVCREEKKTGSRLQTRKVCATPGSQDSSADWVREQQARGAIGASAIVNGQ
jgi:hypothetical protein